MDNPAVGQPTLRWDSQPCGGTANPALGQPPCGWKDNPALGQPTLQWDSQPCGGTAIPAVGQPTLRCESQPCGGTASPLQVIIVWIEMELKPGVLTRNLELRRDRGAVILLLSTTAALGERLGAERRTHHCLRLLYLTSFQMKTQISSVLYSSLLIEITSHI